jgi:hypothetical protein
MQFSVPHITSSLWDEQHFFNANGSVDKLNQEEPGCPASGVEYAGTHLQINTGLYRGKMCIL